MNNIKLIERIVSRELANLDDIRNVLNLKCGGFSEDDFKDIPYGDRLGLLHTFVISSIEQKKDYDEIMSELIDNYQKLI